MKQRSNTGSHFEAGARKRKLTDGIKPKDLFGIPWLLAFALRADAWWLRSDVIWHKLNPFPESVTDRPTRSHEYLFLLTKAREYYYDAKAILEDYAAEWKPATTAGKPGIERQDGHRRQGDGDPDGRNRRTVWSLVAEPCPDAHCAVMPTALAVPCVLAGSRIGDTVIDPFGGSGTTGVVATELGRHAILCELNPEYAEIIKRRTSQQGLFGR